MDKYEYNLKVEKMKKLADRGDYITAAQIADGIDWNRVKNIRDLSAAAMVYENTKQYAQAKELLLAAYDLAPIGRRLLYRLVEMSVKQRDFEDAEMFYREYLEEAPQDLGKYLLRYMILAAKGESLDKQILLLERYKEREFDERWAFELAKLYHKAGRKEDCVKLCDEIILWFSVGPYVDRAIELKTVYAPLTESQMDKVTNKEKYEEDLRQVAREFAEREKQKSQQENSASAASLEEAKPEAGESREAQPIEALEEEPGSEALAAMVQEVMAESSLTKEPEEEAEQETQEPQVQKIKEPAVKEAEPEPAPMVREPEADKKEEDVAKELELAMAAVAKEVSAAKEEDPDFELLKPQKIAKMPKRLILLETVPGEDGTKEAVEAIKSKRESWGEEAAKVARITGDKLNARGLLASLEKLSGADLLVKEAEALEDGILEEIRQVLTNRENRMVIVLESSPEGMERLRETFITYKEARKLRRPKAEPPQQKQEAVQTREEQAEQKPVIKSQPASEKRQESAPEERKAPSEKKRTDKKPEKGLTAEEFVNVIKSYAEELECVVDEMAGLELYVIADQYLENHVVLTEMLAKELTEEAVERAEKHGIRGLFKARYDKEGRLILKEIHFKVK